MTSQIKNKVLCDSTGSMVAESGSGMSSMSLSSIDWTSTTSTPSALARSITSRGLVFLPAFVSTAINTLQNLGFCASPKGIVGIGRRQHHGGADRIDGHVLRVDDTTRDIPSRLSVVRTAQAKAVVFVTSTRFRRDRVAPSLTTR